jgi:hypothetical protein
VVGHSFSATRSGCPSSVRSLLGPPAALLAPRDRQTLQKHAASAYCQDVVMEPRREVSPKPSRTYKPKVNGSRTKGKQQMKWR